MTVHRRKDAAGSAGRPTIGLDWKAPPAKPVHADPMLVEVMAAEPVAIAASRESASVVRPSASPREDVMDAPIRDTADMRRFLLKQMQDAATGKLDTERVRNVCQLSQQVYHATKLELDAMRIMRETDKSIRAIDFVGVDEEEVNG